MKKMTITVGVPASGKTTWAVEQSGKNLNRDDIRQLLFGPFRWGEYAFTKEKEQKVTDTQIELIQAAAKEGRDVIISDTNINPETRKRLESIGKSLGYEIEYRLFHVTKAEAIRRDAKREMSVGESVLNNMYQSYVTNCRDMIVGYFGEEIQFNMFNNMGIGRNTVIVDVDGTVADMQRGFPGARRAYDWRHVGEDQPRPNVILMVQLLQKSGMNIVFVSGRDCVCYSETWDWLKKHVGGVFGLVMREHNDMRPDWLVKLEIIKKLTDPRSVGGEALVVKFMIDDRNQVVDTMREIGMEVFQVAPGNF